jgi:hypothetical protein
LTLGAVEDLDAPTARMQARRSLTRCGSTSSAGRTSSAGGMIARRKQAKSNRALPVLAAMLKYAEALGCVRRGSSPSRGTPCFKRKAMERFLNSAEYRRLWLALGEAEETHPAQVAIVRLLRYTGARSHRSRKSSWSYRSPIQERHPRTVHSRF